MEYSDPEYYHFHPTDHHCIVDLDGDFENGCEIFFPVKKTGGEKINVASVLLDEQSNFLSIYLFESSIINTENRLTRFEAIKRILRYRRVPIDDPKIKITLKYSSLFIEHFYGKNHWKEYIHLLEQLLNNYITYIPDIYVDGDWVKKYDEHGNILGLKIFNNFKRSYLDFWTELDIESITFIRSFKKLYYSEFKCVLKNIDVFFNLFALTDLAKQFCIYFSEENIDTIFFAQIDQFMVSYGKKIYMIEEEERAIKHIFLDYRIENCRLKGIYLYEKGYRSLSIDEIFSPTSILNDRFKQPLKAIDFSQIRPLRFSSDW